MGWRRILWLFAVLVAIGPVGACRKAPPARQYPLTGQVLAVSPDRTEITIRHDDIKGFMPAMTMPFKVKDPALVKDRQPGDLVNATLFVTDDEAWLEGIRKTGWAAFPETPSPRAPAFELLRAGEAISDETLIDQDGNSFRLSSLRGSAVLLTFIYTRCPLPDYCPRMDRNFQAVQRAIAEGRAPHGIRLISVSFDPDYDTPAILKAHAAAVGANPTTWTFATAPRARIEALGGRLGLSVLTGDVPGSITHNLRTAVIDASGRLVTVLNGNDWTPEQAVSALVEATADRPASR